MKIFFRITIAAVLLLSIVYLLGPSPATPIYDPKPIIVPSLDSLPSYVAKQEALHKVKPGNEAEIIWADSVPQQTAYAVVYLHGFSASKAEGDPIHRYLANALHANLYLARLADHGIDTVAPMQFFTAERLWESSKQALAIGKKLGKKVILVGTSTGGTMALQLAATYPEVNSLVLLSPNIKINDPNAWLANNPWGLQIARMVIGGTERKLTGKSQDYQKYWYTHYRLESVVQLQELLETTMKKSLFEKVKQPVLMLYFYKDQKEQDPVVRVDAMLQMFEELGSAHKEKLAMPNVGNHVLGSSITSKDLMGVERAMDHFIAERLSEKQATSTLPKMAKSMKRIEGELLKQFEKIEYWSSESRKQEKQGYDSLFKANNDFKKMLLDATTDNPATLNYNFPLLVKAHLMIAQSADRLVKIYSWNKQTGGTMHFFDNVFQYKDGNKVISESAAYEETNAGGFYSEIFTLHTPKKPIYLCYFNGILSSSESYASIDALMINDHKLMPSYIFKNKKLESSMGFEFDFFSVVDRPERPVKLIDFDANQQLLKMPVIDEKGKVTANQLTYRFTGKYFEKVK
ncbi:MAG: alpha/beta fold hydrolase [Pedobacter sp.]|nr:alpha/beta fold hydrolase [Pedobacter sp.]